MKFTLRDVFWLIAVLALICGWYVDHRAQSIARNKDLKFWDRTTSHLIKGWRDLQAENEALKAASQQQATQP